MQCRSRPCPERRVGYVGLGERRKVRAKAVIGVDDWGLRVQR